MYYKQKLHIGVSQCIGRALCHLDTCNCQYNIGMCIRLATTLLVYYIEHIEGKYKGIAETWEVADILYSELLISICTVYNCDRIRD